MITNVIVSDLCDWRSLANSQLRARAAKSTGGWAHFFVARVGTQEAGILVLDLLDRPPCASIREIFVSPCYRRRKVGETLLAHAEKVARRENLLRIVLEAHPLDTDTSREFLVQWYRTNGFITVDGHPGKMTKELAVLRN